MKNLSFIVEYPGRLSRIVSFEDPETYLKRPFLEFYHRLLLRASKNEVILWCGCQRCGGQPHLPKLCVREKKLPATVKIEWFRRRVSEHTANGCFAAHLRYGQSPSGFNGAIFNVGRGGNAQKYSPKIRAVSKEERRPKSDFSAVCTSLVAAANLRAFLNLNASGELPKQPGPLNFFQELNRQFEAPLFKGGSSALSESANRESELIAGLILPRRGHLRADLEIAVVDWFSGSENSFRRTAHHCPSAIVERALQSTRSRKHGHRPPPYLVLAVVDSDREIKKLWLRSVWIGCNGLHLVESDLERRNLARLSAERSVLFRPMHDSDFVQLRSMLPFSFPSWWRHLPDWIEFSYDRPIGSGRPVFGEVYGFEEGDLEQYDRDRENNEQLYAKIEDSVVFQPQNGTTLLVEGDTFDFPPGIRFEPTFVERSLKRRIAETYGLSLSEEPQKRREGR